MVAAGGEAAGVPAGLAVQQDALALAVVGEAPSLVELEVAAAAVLDTEPASPGHAAAAVVAEASAALVELAASFSSSSQC